MTPLQGDDVDLVVIPVKNVCETGKLLASDSVGKRDESKSTGSLKANGELSPMGRDVVNGSPVGRGYGNFHEVSLSFGEE